MAKSKIGLHLNGLFGAVDDWVSQARPQVLVSLDHNPDHWRVLRGISPNTFVVGRYVAYDDGDPRYYPTLDMDTPATSAQKAEAFFTAMRPDVEKMRGLYHAWVGINEPVCKTNQHAQNLSAWHARWGDLMRSIGIVSTAYSFSQGVPESYHWPLLAEGLRHCDLLSLHEYWCPHLNSVGMIPYHVLRYRTAYQTLPTGAQRKLVITECGVDGGAANVATAGWKQFVSEAQYLADIKAYDAELQKDAYVIGASIFCAGGGFPSWDIVGANSIPAWIGSTGDALPITIIPPPGGGNLTNIEHTALIAGANKFGIPINDQAALCKFALANHLGIPMTDEYEFVVDTVTYVGQVWSKAVVYCRKGDWGNIKMYQ